MYYYYYDANGYLISSYTNSDYLGPLQNGEQYIRVHSEYNKTYETRKVVVKAERSSRPLGERVIDNISFEYEKSSATNSLNVKIKNNSNRIIKGVNVDVLYFDANGKVIGFQGGNTSKVYAPGYEDTIAIEYPYTYVDQYYTQKQYIEPASYIAYVRGAYVDTDAESGMTATGGLEFYDDYSRGIDVQVYETADGKTEYYVLKNTMQDKIYL